MRVFTKQFPLNYIRLSPLYRTTAETRGVLQSFGITPSIMNVERMCRYPSKQFFDVCRIIEIVSEVHNIDHIKVDSPKKVTGKDFSILPIDILEENIKGFTLDLRGIHGKLLDKKARAQQEEHPLPVIMPMQIKSTRISQLVSAILAEAQKFKALELDPTATIEDVFETIDEGKGNLGFLNVAVYRPVSNGNVSFDNGTGHADVERNWIRTRRNLHWTEDIGKYDPRRGGQEPVTTLKSVILANGEIFDVDICHLETFDEAGLSYDPNSIENDFRYARGAKLTSGEESRRILFIKIRSDKRGLFKKYGTEAVLCFSNQVRRESRDMPSPLLPEDTSEAEIIKGALSQFYVGSIISAIERIREREMRTIEVEDAASLSMLIPRTSKLLTDNLLFNPNSGVAYPRNENEYYELIRRITDQRGVFPGDTEPMVGGVNFSADKSGAKHFLLKRKGVVFEVEIFSPHLHAQGRKNRLAFDADLLSQASSEDAYGTKGVSYDREYYYDRRLWDSQKVPFIRLNSWPISFSAMQGYQTTFDGDDLFYGFIHFVMTRGLFQGYGLTSYAVREGMSSIFYEDIMRNYPNLFIEEDGTIKDRRFKMWIAAHSGRFPAAYSFFRGFGPVNDASAPIAEKVIRDVHGRITPPEDSGRSLDFLGVRPIDGNGFALALDHQVYPPHNRYEYSSGRVVFSQSEMNLPEAYRKAWLDAIGGEMGLADGNGLYFAGVGSFNRIRVAKRREKEREGQGAIMSAGDWLRRNIIKRM